MNEAEIARYLELGRENARIMELAADHCRDMRFVEIGGRGMLEEESGLPLNMRRVECPVAIGNTAGMRLDHVTFGFYADHCGGCDLRKPTGRIPNLETEVRTRQQEAEAQRAERAERLRLQGVERAVRVERRRSLRATADPATVGILDDLDLLEVDPTVDVDADATAAARRRLTTVAGRAADRFDERVIDELFDAVESVGVTQLLESLRHLTSRRPELAHRLVTTALSALRSFPTLEAGRCLTDYPDLVDAASIDDAVIWAVVVLAGAKTPEDHHFSGPTPVVQANDPGPLRVLADLCPDKLVARLGGMLPRPAVTGIIVNPAHQPPLVSDVDRRAAAGAVEHLASAHLELAVQLLPALAVSLSVPPEDSYDPATVGAVERAIARMFIAAPVRIAGLLEDAGRYAAEATRDGLVGSVRHALEMVDTEYFHRRPHDPVVTPEEEAVVTEWAFVFLLGRTDESWGAKVTFSAADAIEQVGRWHRDALAGRMDATLGAFVTLTRHRLTTRNSVLTSAAVPDPLAGLEAFSREHSLYQSAQRLLRAVESASSTDPLAVCATITALITSERDSDLGAEVVCPLLATLGEIGRSHGNQPGVIQAILPTLHTYLVDADPGPRAEALEAWTAIGGTHALPSTVADLLPALVLDTHVVMIDAVLKAACRLIWPDQESRIRLIVHAANVMKGINVSKHLDTFLTSLSALRRHVPNLAALAELEKEALTRVPELEGYQATKVIEQPWQPGARVAPELAVLWLMLAPQSTYGFRQHDEAEKALNGLLDCGVGLLGLPAANIIEVGVAHSPESHQGSVEYAEVLARAERRTDALALLEGALTRIPHEPARSAQRAMVALACAVGRLQVTLEPASPVDADVRTAVDEIGAAISTCLSRAEDDAGWLQPYAKDAAVRAAIICTVLDIPIPAKVAAGIADTPAGQQLASSDNPAGSGRAVQGARAAAPRPGSCPPARRKIRRDSDIRRSRHHRATTRRCRTPARRRERRPERRYHAGSSAPDRNSTPHRRHRPERIPGRRSAPRAREPSGPRSRQIPTRPHPSTWARFSPQWPVSRRRCCSSAHLNPNTPPGRGRRPLIPSPIARRSLLPWCRSTTHSSPGPPSSTRPSPTLCLCKYRPTRGQRGSNGWTPSSSAP
ncbi:hypothetical protein [Actinokineospora diospyrosa]|uniref:hypothetical protein n=1 Tax=Actinokineospora diospyrosa TaxID=103728 RepID=UPI0020A3108C|nr:hypothetical protein [Actinokineospora diospyrosa]